MALVKMIMPNDAPTKPLASTMSSIGALLFMSTGGRPNAANPWLITDGGPFYDTTVYALYVYKRAFENGQYAYGAALALGLVVVGIIVALSLWRFFDMRALLQKPRIEVS